MTLKTTYGHHTDGTPAEWVWRNTLGSLHGMVFGGIGTGKTTLLTTLAAGARDLGMTVWYTSGYDFAEPGMEAIADQVFTGPELARALTTPPPSGQLRAVFVDDGERAMTAEVMDTWERAVQGSVRTSVVLAMYSPRPAAMYGSTHIQGLVRTGNVVGLRSLLAGRTFLPCFAGVDLGGLPNRPGLGYAALGGKQTNPHMLTVSK